MITFVLPTHGRPGELGKTLEALDDLGELGGTSELIVVDNSSPIRPECPERLRHGLPVRVIRNETNEGAAGRNVGVRSARNEWVMLLDDDSAPTDRGFLDVLQEQPEDVAAVMANITLTDGSREQGGLPEVPIGCGVAVRKWAFLAAGGYDHAFGFYAEEYDLAAKLLLADRRVVFDPRFGVLHRKVSTGRDMGLILQRLIRNNGWVLQRYCPEHELEERLIENEARYRAIAEKENAVAGFERGLVELVRTIGEQTRLPMEQQLWDRFTGLAAARHAIGAAHEAEPFTSARVVERGKNAWVIERVLAELGVVITVHSAVSIIGTMSLGPMLDAGDRLRVSDGQRVILPWANRTERARFDRDERIETDRSVRALPAA